MKFNLNAPVPQGKALTTGAALSFPGLKAEACRATGSVKERSSGPSSLDCQWKISIACVSRTRSEADGRRNFFNDSASMATTQSTW